MQTPHSCTSNWFRWEAFQIHLRLQQGSPQKVPQWVSVSSYQQHGPKVKNIYWCLKKVKNYLVILPGTPQGRCCLPRSCWGPWDSASGDQTPRGLDPDIRKKVWLSVPVHCFLLPAYIYTLRMSYDDQECLPDYNTIGLDYPIDFVFVSLSQLSHLW